MKQNKRAGIVTIYVLICSFISIICLPSPSLSQEGRIVREVIYSSAIEGNLLGDDPNREVSIYLPAAYDKYPTARFPVVYLFPDWGSSNIALETVFKIESVGDTLFKGTSVQPMIIVTPNTHNKYRGTFYTNSYVIGNWEAFITLELVDYIDSNYRTLTEAGSRGIAGYLIGSYGALKLAMRHPDIYSAVYGLSVAWMDFEEVNLGTMKSYLMQAVNAIAFDGLPWQAQAMIAQAVAFTPDSTSLPFLCNFPITSNGDLIDSLWQQWLIHDPLSMVNSHVDNLLQLKGIKFDSGTEDYELITANRKFSKKLNDESILHTYSEYEGDYQYKLQGRIKDELLPFFADTLEGSLYSRPIALSVQSHPRFISKQGDTLVINTQLYDPENRPITVKAIISGEQHAFTDTITLYDDGQHTDGDESDNIWGNSAWLSDLPEDNYSIAISTQEMTEDSPFYLSPTLSFTTIGPIVYEGLAFARDTIANPGENFRLKLVLKNNGVITTAPNISATLSSSDSCVSISLGAIPFGDIAPGESSTHGWFMPRFSDSCPINTPIPFRVDIASNNFTFWSDTFSIRLLPTAIEGNENNIPMEFALNQNYPNPFNPSTSIEFTLPKFEYVKLKIYNTRGKEVKTLVSKNLNPGNHIYQFDGKNLASGVYYYRLVAGDNTEVRKMILLK